MSLNDDEGLENGIHEYVRSLITGTVARRCGLR